MADTPDCHTCRLRGISRPAVTRGWHRSRWRLEAACADHAAALDRATAIVRAAPAPPPPWVSAAPPRAAQLPAGLPLPPRQPARPRPAPAAPAGPPVCRTCQLRGVSRPAVVRGWHRSRWRHEAACADHAPALARAVPLGPAPAGRSAPLSPAAAPATAAVPAPAPRQPSARRRRPALVAAGGIVVAGAAAIVGVVASGSSPAPAPAPALPAVSGAGVAAGPPPVRVPHLIGLPLSRARGALQGVHLVIARRRTGAAAAGVILAQRPGPGVRVARGSALLLTVALPAVSTERPSPAPPPAPAVGAAVPTRAPSAPALAGAACERVPSWGRAWGAFRCR